MLGELKKLKDLQLIDAKIFELEEEYYSLPEENSLLDSEISEMNKKLNELRDGVAIQLEEKEKREEILKKGEDKLKTITGKQAAIRNQDEYKALVREVDNIKRFNRDLSDEIADIEREIEFKNNELKLIEEETVKKIEENKEKMLNNEKRIKDLDTILDSSYEKREALVVNIRPIVYRKYQRIFESSLNGKAIAIAENRICHGCNMTLPPELFNVVLKATNIEVCPNCQCILIPADKEEN
ncbi:MAG: zinc ribbon domain-containing protein [bacterium]